MSERPGMLPGRAGSGTGATVRLSCLGDSITRAQLHLVQAGDHLCGNTRWRWLSQTSDWLGDQLENRH